MSEFLSLNVYQAGPCYISGVIFVLLLPLLYVVYWLFCWTSLFSSNSFFILYLSCSLFYLSVALLPCFSCDLEIYPQSSFSSLCHHDFSFVTHCNYWTIWFFFTFIWLLTIISPHSQPPQGIIFSVSSLPVSVFLSLDVQISWFSLNLFLSPCADMLLRSISVDSWKRNRGS